MDSAVLTRSSKSNKSIFQPVKQTDTITEYTLGTDGYNKTHNLHRLLQSKKKKVFGPDFPTLCKQHSVTQRWLWLPHEGSS